MAIQVAETSVATLLYGADLYRVPLYQRDFSWTLEELSNFWDDVILAVEGSESIFFGSVILVGTGNPTLWEVLDGQQRLTAFSLLLAAARDNYPTESTGRTQAVEGLMRTDIGAAFGGGMTHRLHLNRRDDSYFAPIALGDAPSSAAKPSHRRIKSAYEFLNQAVGQRVASTSSEQFSVDLMKALTEQLRVIRIAMDDVNSAEMVFEAVNSAGLDLTESDLIKNHLLRSAVDGQEEALYQVWDASVGRVEEGQGQVTDFIRTSFNSRYEFARKSNLYRSVKDLVPVRLPASEFVNRLSQDSLAWSQLKQGSINALAALAREQVARDLRELWTYNIKLVEVPLLAINHLSEEESASFVKAVRWFRDFFVRYSVVGGLASNRIEVQFSSWAIRLRGGDMTTDELYASLSALAPSDDLFREAFKAFTPKVQKVARIILARINDHSGNNNVITETYWAGLNVHLEHVVPQEPEKWVAQLEEFKAEGLEYEDVLNNIGNLTLLPPSVNIGISNYPFLEKRWAYQGRKNDEDPSAPNPAPINTLLAGFEEFCPNEFDARRQWLADRAVEVWSLAP